MKLKEEILREFKNMKKIKLNEIEILLLKSLNSKKILSLFSYQLFFFHTTYQQSLEN